MCASIAANATESEYAVALEKFVEIFERKNKKQDVDINSIPHEYMQKLAGHVICGSTEAQFENLDKGYPVKKFAWTIGDDGLTLFLTQSNIQALRSIGLNDRGIRKKLEQGNHFRLGIFYRPDNWIPATWDGVFSLIDAHYSDNISTKIRRHRDALKQMSFDEIEARAQLSFLGGASYFDVSQLPFDIKASDPRFMSEERFSECEGTLEETRGFLHNRLALTGLYDGSGFTKDSNGRLFVREYLQPNVPVRDIPGFRYLILPIDDAELAPDS